MSTIVNDRDLALQAVYPRIIVTSVAIAGDGAVFIKGKNGGSVTPTDITLTAITTIFTSPTLTWYYAVDTSPGTWTSLGTGATQTISGATFSTAVGTGTSITYKVVATQTGFITSENTFIITYSRETDEAYSLSISKTSVIVSADSSGVPLNYNDSGITIGVVRGGTTSLNYGTTGSNVFSVGTPTVSPTTAISMGTLVGSGTTAVFSNITNMLTGTDYATASFVVTIRDAGGTALTPTTFVQTFTKVKAGSTSSSTPTISVVDPLKIVATLPDGSGGSYSGVNTPVKVFTGTTDETSTWVFAITPDSGITSTINGGAGPITGSSTITVAVSASTVTSGRVTIVATKSGQPTLTGYFTVTKSLSGNDGYQHYILPDVVTLPVDSNNHVSSYLPGIADYRAIRGTIDDTSNWTLSKVDSGVTSTITSSGRITITNFIEPNTISLGTSTTVTLPSGWASVVTTTHNPNTGTTILLSGHTSSTVILRTTDWITFTQVTIPSALPTTVGAAAFANNTFVVLKSGVSSNKAMYSTDDGVTWSESTMPTTQQWTSVVWTGSRWLAFYYGNQTANAQSTNGITWSAYTTSNVNNVGGGLLLASNDVGTIVAINNSNQTMYLSTNGGTAWGTNSIANVGSDITTSGPWFVNEVIYFKGYFIISYSGGVSSKYRVSISSDGVTWSNIAIPLHSYRSFVATTNKLILISSGQSTHAYTDNAIQWDTLTGVNLSSNVAGYRQPQGTSYIQFYDGSANSAKKLDFNPTGDYGTVTVTATKTGQATTSRILKVVKGQIQKDVYTEALFPSSYQLAATFDGVVTSFSGAIFSAIMYKNGIVDTANWSFTVSVSDASITYTGSAGTYTLTGFGTTVSSGTFTIAASKIGQPLKNMVINISKNKGSTNSGPSSGSSYSAFTTSSGYVGLRFKNDGTFQVKYGSGGSYTQAGFWYQPVTASIGSSYWLRVTTTGDALTSGTTGTWQAMTSDLDYTLTRAITGVSTTNLIVDLGNTSTGGTVTRGYGTLVVEVP